jgi:hypothetical protein
MDDELVFILVFGVISLFLFIGVILVIVAFAILLTRSLYKSESIRKISRKWDFEFYGIEDIRERLDDIAEIKKSNKIILEKLNYLTRGMNEGNIE